MTSENLLTINWTLWFKIITINCIIIIILAFYDGLYRKRRGRNRAVSYVFSLALYLIVFLCLNQYLFSIELKTFVYYFILPSFAFFLLFGLFTSGQRSNQIIENIRVPYKKGVYDFVLQNNGANLRFADPLDNFLIYAGANSGKTKSIGKPLLEEYFRHDFAGLVFDYKEKDYTHFIAALNEKYPHYPHEVYYIDFEHVKHRFNLVKPALYDDPNDILQLIEDIYNANSTGNKNNGDPVWDGASKDILKAVATKFYYDYPQYCTIPYIFNFALRRDIEDVIDICSTNFVSKGYLKSIEKSMKSEKTLGSVIFTMSQKISKIANNKKVCYLLNGDDFDFNLIEPGNGKLVSIANNRRQEDLLSPIISAMVTASSRQFSLENKTPFVYFLDEGTSFHINKFETMPSVLREYGVSFVLITQSGSKITIQYDRESKSSIESNFGNQFFGKTKDTLAAQNYVKLFHTQKLKKHSKSRGMSRGVTSSGVTESEDRRAKYEVADFSALPPGNFIGSALHSNYSEFNLNFKMTDTKNAENLPLVRSVTDGDIDLSYKKMIKNILYIKK